MSKKVLVTGANGMLGQDLCPVLGQNGYEVIKTDANNMDITDYNTVQIVINKHAPDIVIHCAAYTNVDKAEEDYDAAYKINVTGTENIAQICGEKNITLIYISTDYVFSGESSKKYKPDDKANPINNYGKTKWLGEQAVRKFCRKNYIVRTAWLYGIHGKNFVETIITLANTQSEIKVVNDQIGCPTWTIELCKGILKLLSDKPFGTYHVCGSGETSWYGFAKEIFSLCEIKTNLVPCTTEEFPRSAKRPKYSVMDNNGLCRNWKDALSDYIKLR